MLDIDKISKLGLGTWGLGGFARFDSDIDTKKQQTAVAYTLSKGINYVETTLWYSEGHAAQILADAIQESGVVREQIFISQAIYEYDQTTLESFSSEMGIFHKLLRTDYSDAVLVTMPGAKKFGVEKVFDWMDNLLNQGLTRYVSVTNANLEFLKLMQRRFGDKLFGHELHVNFEIRVMEELGIVKFADEHKIKNIIAQPLRRNRTAAHNWPLLKELADKYAYSQNQIILAWMMSRGFLPLVKSEKTEHIDENLHVLDITIDPGDVEKINAWRPDYRVPEIDWNKSGKGVDAAQLANVFDEEYERQRR
ncbi:MAG TPA: aldo/keto reductase [Candidatus Saccharimonadales bacterium]|nr:aldo/keto reductase [Candidatus Saccharimonadales bacterium]